MDILIRENLNRNCKSDVYDFLTNESSKVDKSHKLMLDGGFKKYFPQLYSQIIENEELNKFTSFKQKMWHFFNDNYEIHYCPVCGKELDFISFQKGYRQFCSNECKYNDENYLYKVSENTREMWRTNEKMKFVVKKIQEGRDRWWSSLSKEERVEHTKPLHDAMNKSILNMSDDQKKEMYRKSVEKVKFTKTNWSQEKKDDVERKRKESYQNTLSNRSEEKRKLVRENVSNGLKNMTDEQKQQRDINKHLSILKRTQEIYPEVIDVFTRKGNKNTIYTCSCQNSNCNKCENRIYKTTVGSFVYRKKMGIDPCPICHPNTIGTSSGEKNLLKYIQSIYSGIILENDRVVLDGKEIDVYLPELKLGFEFQGDIWHANPFLFDESYVNPVNHKTYAEIHSLDDEKKRCAMERDINIIEIWEMDWNNHPRLTKKMIKDLILGR